MPWRGKKASTGRGIWVKLYSDDASCWKTMKLATKYLVSLGFMSESVALPNLACTLIAAY